MEKISALMDGELDHADIATLVPDIKQSAQLREAWATYHLIGDALRRQACGDHSIAQRVAEQLKTEPTVLAPSLAKKPQFLRRYAMPSIAAAAAIATVTWMSLATQQHPGVAPTAIAPIDIALPVATFQHSGGLAEMAQPAAFALSQPAIELATRPIDAYLLAHQEFSPSTTMQGLAPYVRMVTSGPVGQGR